MDVNKLIAEIRLRPALWDPTHPDHKNRTETKRIWHNLSDIIGASADDCRSKWKNLRCSYRRHCRNALNKSQLGESMGSEWPYSEPMSFLDMHGLLNDSIGGNDGNDNGNDVGDAVADTDSAMSFKEEPMPTDDMEADNDALMEEFRNVATPQALRRLSHSISLASAAAEEQAHVVPMASGQSSNIQFPSLKLENVRYGVGAGVGAGAVAAAGAGGGGGGGGVCGVGTATAAAAASSCHCAKRVDEQVNFLENLKREEQQLMQSTNQDLARCKNVLHVGDSDYNYLISFLPLMKQMSPLQNVFFRAKMGELLLQTMQQPPVGQQQQQQQARQQQMQQEQPQPSQMLLNQQQMALDQAQVSTSSTNWN